MSDTNTQDAAGVDNFLDRLEDALNETSGANSLEDQRQQGDADQDNQQQQQADSLDGLTDEKPKADADPLNDLSDEANKGGDESGQKPDKSGQDENAHTDVLAEFDAADQDKIRSYIDEQIAKEVTATESAGGAFKRLKSENRALEQQVRELNERTAEPEALKAATDRISELESQVRANEEANSVLRLEDTQAYREAVTEPQQAIVSASDDIADRYGVDRDQLANLLGNPNRRELSEKLVSLLGDDVADADKFELYDLSRRAEATFTKRRELHDNAEAALQEAEELASKAKEREALASRQSREQAATDTLERLKSKAKFIIDIVGEDTLEAYKTNAAERPVSSLSDADQAFARLAFDSLIPLAKHVRTLESELQTANDDIVKLRGSGPGGGGGGGSRTTEDDTRDKQLGPSTGIGSAVDRIADALNGFEG